MKLIKYTLLTITLLSIGSVFARKMGGPAAPAGRPAAVTPPARVTPPGRPAAQIPTPLPEESFASYLQKIRSMDPEDVIDANAKFTDTFKAFVSSSNLDQDLMRALLEAGINLHLPLRENNQASLSLISDAMDQIDDLLVEEITLPGPRKREISEEKIVVDLPAPVRKKPAQPAAGGVPKPERTPHETVVLMLPLIEKDLKTELLDRQKDFENQTILIIARDLFQMHPDLKQLTWQNVSNTIINAIRQVFGSYSMGMAREAYLRGTIRDNWKDLTK